VHMCRFLFDGPFLVPHYCITTRSTYITDPSMQFSSAVFPYNTLWGGTLKTSRGWFDDKRFEAYSV
jgi:hypothetical protein